MRSTAWGSTSEHGGGLASRWWLGYPSAPPVQLVVAEDALVVSAAVLDFVRTPLHLRAVGDATDGPDEGSMYITFRHRDAWQPPRGSGSSTLVRRRTPGKHVYGTRWSTGDTTTLHITTSDTALELAEDGTHATVYLSSASRFHASDLVRDVVWEVSSDAGHFVHAAAVATEAGVIALVGDKGAGKTTTAIDFLRGGASLLSGDVLYVAPDGRVESFPDFPHVGWGTLRSVPQLFKAAVVSGATPGPDLEKVLLPHTLYADSLGAKSVAGPLPWRAVVAPQISAPGPAVLRPCDPIPHLLDPMVRQTSDPEEGWEPFLAAVRQHAATTPVPTVTTWSGAALGDGLQWFARTGSGPLPEESVRRILAGLVP